MTTTSTKNDRLFRASKIAVIAMMVLTIVSAFSLGIITIWYGHWATTTSGTSICKMERMYESCYNSDDPRVPEDGAYWARAQDTIWKTSLTLLAITVPSTIGVGIWAFTRSLT